jgi:shikimate dehydrogenase
MVRCAVVGSPVAHSLSPVLHRAGYAAHGLDWSYQAVEVDADGLPDFLAGLDESWRGLSLTMPLKRAVLPHLDRTSETAGLAGAVNTLLIDGGRRVGHNTDVPGAVAAIRERLDGPLDEVELVGGGATAASIVVALAQLGVRRLAVAVRDVTRARRTVDLAVRLLGAHAVRTRDLAEYAATPEPVDLLVCTLPAPAQNPRLLAGVAQARCVFDVAYDPWPTPLAAVAMERGVPVVSGLDLLVHQAVPQFELMTGLPAPMREMRAAAGAALTARGAVGPRFGPQPQRPGAAGCGS